MRVASLALLLVCLLSGGPSDAFAPPATSRPTLLLAHHRTAATIQSSLFMADGGDGDERSELMKKMMGGRAPLKEKMPSSPPPPPQQQAGGGGIPAYSAIPPPPPPPPSPQGAQQQQGVPPPPPPPPPSQQAAQQAAQPYYDAAGNPIPPPPPPPPQPPQYYDANGNPIQIPPQPQYYDQYGNPIPVPMTAQPYGAVPPPPSQMQQQPQTPPPPKAVIGGAGTRRNPDADRIVNSADVYLAQLKRDSTVRTMARHYGDVESANKVFEDPEIEKIKEELVKNPYLQAEQEKVNSLLESGPTSDDEAMLFAGAGGSNPFFDEGPSRDAKQTKYKEKLAQLKSKKKEKNGGDGGGAGAGDGDGDGVVEEEKKEVVEEGTASSSSSFAAAAAGGGGGGGGMGFPSTYAVTPPEETTVPATAAAAAAAAAAQAAVPVPPAEPVAASASPTPSGDIVEDEEQIRRNIRTLMGLILKHRGGPGFGTGVLKAPEATRLKSTLEDVTAILRKEAGTEGGGSAAAESAAEEESAAAVAVAPVAESAAVAAPEAQAAAATTSSDDEEQTRRDIRTLMGLILKHRGGPGFGSGVLKAPEATRLKGLFEDVSAILREEVGEEEGSAPPPASPPAAADTSSQTFTSVCASDDDIPAPLSGAIACVEGAVKMFKAASPAERDPLLPSVRSALLSAADTLAAVESKTKGGASMSSPPAPPAPTGMGFPSTYAITEPEQEEEAVVAAPDPATASVADDANTIQLREINKKLKSMAGDGKFGLKNLTENEMASLGDALIDMRGILMEELDAGIPAAEEKSPTGQVKQPAMAAKTAVSTDVSPEQSTGSSSAGSGSKYQQMLAKSKTEKEAKKNA